MRTVIVLETHNSGSNLVYDYLACRNDFNSPFDHNEFRIWTDPRGLNYPYTNCYKNNATDILNPIKTSRSYENEKISYLYTN